MGLFLHMLYRGIFTDHSNFYESVLLSAKDMYKEFDEHIQKVVEEFRTWPLDEAICAVTNLDADGICAGSIVVRALQRENRKHAVKIIHQLKEDVIQELAKDSYTYFVFSDLGSGQLINVNKYLGDCKILILDHHQLQGEPNSNILHINPLPFDVDGSGEVCASGVSFLFARALDPINEDMAHIAMVGAIGDVQESDGFTGVNNLILEIAKSKGLIQVHKGLKFFGLQTRPIHKLLEYSSDMKIPGITGSESGAIQFLQTLGIDPKKGSSWKTFGDLTQEEVQRLTAAIIMKKGNDKNPEDIFTKVYTLPGEEVGSPLRDAKEFSTLLNACGRLSKASLGMGACLNDPALKKLAIEEMAVYRKELVKALNWFDANKDSDKVFKTERFMIINAEKNILATMIGTTASILSRGSSFPNDFIILSMAQNTDNTTKISLRVVGDAESIDCKDLVCKMVEQSAGEAGGHKHAAGAVIPTEKEAEFVQAAKDILTKASQGL